MKPRPAADTVDLPGAAQLLGMSVRKVRRLIKRDQFTPATIEAGGDAQLWNTRELWSWAAQHAPGRAAAMPLKHWAAQSGPPSLDTVRTVRGAIVQDWSLADAPVLLRVVWPTGDFMNSDTAAAARLEPRVPWVLQVGPGFAVFGPELDSYGPDGRTAGEGGWRDYAEIMGGVADYWPSGLRDPQMMQAWEPGDPQPVVVPDPALDTAPLLRLASMLDPETPAARTLLNLARTVHYKATIGPEVDVKLVREENRFARVRLAALPMDVPEADTDDLPESIRRAGWLEVLARGDVLAVDVVRSLLVWNGGEGLPFCKRETLDPAASELSREWVQRLVPAPNGRTAAFEIALSPDDRPVEYLIDPDTDAPAARMNNGTVLTAVPQRLFTQSPLAQVVLDTPIWIRVADGTLSGAAAPLLRDLLELRGFRARLARAAAGPASGRHQRARRGPPQRRPRRAGGLHPGPLALRLGVHPRATRSRPRWPAPAAARRYRHQQREPGRGRGLTMSETTSPASDRTELDHLLDLLEVLPWNEADSDGAATWRLDAPAIWDALDDDGTGLLANGLIDYNHLRRGGGNPSTTASRLSMYLLDLFLDPTPELAAAIGTCVRHILGLDAPAAAVGRQWCADLAATAWQLRLRGMAREIRNGRS